MFLPNAELCLIVGVLSALLGYGLENRWKKQKISSRIRRVGLLVSILFVLFSLISMALLIPQKYSYSEILWDEKLGQAKITLSNMRPVYRYGLAEPVALAFTANIGPISEEIKPKYEIAHVNVHDCISIRALSVTDMVDEPLFEEMKNFGCAKKSSIPLYWTIETVLPLNERLIRDLMKLNESNKKSPKGDLPQFCIGPESASTPKIPAKPILDSAKTLSIRWNYHHGKHVKNFFGQTIYYKENHAQNSVIPVTPEIRDMFEKLRGGYEQLSDANLLAQGYNQCGLSAPTIHCYCKDSAP